MTATLLQSLGHRWTWIALGAAAGCALGVASGRIVGPAYESNALITFQGAGAHLNQASEVSAAIAAAFRLSDTAGMIERESPLVMRRLAVVPAEREAVAIELQAYGDSAGVQDAAGRAARRASIVLGEAAASRPSDAAGRPRAADEDGGSAWAAIEREVADRLPAPIRSTVRPWYEVTLQPQPAAPPVAIGRRPALGGLLAGIGVAILGVFVDRQRNRLGAR